MTPNSCSCHVCIDKPYLVTSKELGIGPAVPVGLQDLFDYSHTMIPFKHEKTAADVVKDAFALYAPDPYLCPKMTETEHYLKHQQFPAHSTQPETWKSKAGVITNPAIIRWQTHNEFDEWIASLPAVYFAGSRFDLYAGPHHHGDNVHFWSAYDLVLGNTKKKQPRFAHRGQRPKSNKNPCGKEKQFALCTYCIHVIVSILCISTYSLSVRLLSAYTLSVLSQI